MITYSPDISKELRRLPFHSRYERLGLRLEESDGWLIPSEFHSLKTELKLLSEGRGVVDFSDRGILELSGKDTIDFLHRISTNDFLSPDSPSGIQTLLLSEKGRVLDSILVIRWEGKILAVTSRSGEQHAKEWLERFIIMDDVSVRDATGEYALLARPLGGNAADQPLRYLLGSSVITKYFETDTEFLITNKDATVVTQLEDKGLAQAGDDAYEAFRIGKGIPRYGKEITGEFNPLELNLRSQISFDKGCYIGQEIVARLDTYQKVKRRLCLVRWSESIPNSGAAILISEGREAGLLTSRSPEIGEDNSMMGLAVVRKEYAVKGGKIRAKLNDAEVIVQYVFES